MGAKVARVSPDALRDFVFERSLKISRDFVELDEIKLVPSFRSGGVVDQAWAEAKRTAWTGKDILEVAEGRDHIDNQPPRIREVIRNLTDENSKFMMEDLARRQIEAGEVEHDELEEEARKGNFYDAIDVSFLVSAPEIVTDCYAVLICTIRAGSGKSQVGHVVFFCEIGSIGQRPRRMKAQVVGVPPGFRLLRTEFHVYSRAQELATNVAPNRVALSERQANQFAVLQYVMSNKGETKPARVASAPLLSDDLRRIAEKEMNLNVRFEIGAMGEVKAISGSSPTKALHDYISSIQFFPAVENGKAIASTLTVGLRELVR